MIEFCSNHTKGKKIKAEKAFVVVENEKMKKNEKEGTAASSKGPLTLFLPPPPNLLLYRGTQVSQNVNIRKGEKRAFLRDCSSSNRHQHLAPAGRDRRDGGLGGHGSGLDGLHDGRGRRQNSVDDVDDSRAGLLVELDDLGRSGTGGGDRHALAVLADDDGRGLRQPRLEGLALGPGRGVESGGGLDDVLFVFVVFFREWVRERGRKEREKEG